MKLPPRPDEIDPEHAFVPTTRHGGSTGYLTPIRTASPGAKTPQLGASPFAKPSNGDGEALFEVKELKSTLPPLQLSPSMPDHPRISGAYSPRPDLASRNTTPAPSSGSTAWEQVHELRSPGSATSSIPPTDALRLEHNAWADRSEHDEIQMTFE